MGYTFDIHYKPGPTNKVAYALSRKYPLEVECITLVTLCAIQAFIEKDTTLQRLRTKLQKGEVAPKWFCLENGVLKYKGQVVIPSKSELRTRLLREYHDSPINAWLLNGIGQECRKMSPPMLSNVMCANRTRPRPYLL